MEEKKSIRRVRVFHIVQYEVNPKTGEKLFDETNIKNGLQIKSISRYAYTCHDKDFYTINDENKYPEHKAGTTKPRHWHIVGECKSNIALDRIAKMFGVPENCILIPKGRDAFMDNVEYLTHERYPKDEKHLYNDDEIASNFNFRSIIDKKNYSLIHFGRTLKPRDFMRAKVLYDGMTLRECQEYDKIEYMNDLSYLKKVRMEYINNQMPPTLRLNYYVDGPGGIGKGLLCRAIARNLFPDLEDDRDIFFNVGARGAAFEGYDGQPVIIWNDRRGIDLLMELNGRENVFNIFDSHPTIERQNVKYGSVNLCNSINIINSVESYEDFLNSLVGEYKDRDGNVYKVEDKSQSYRRFPFMIVVHEEDFDLLLNKGFCDGTRAFYEYYEYRHIRGNLQQIAIKCGTNKNLQRRIETQTVVPIIEKTNAIKDSFNQEPEDEVSVLKEFESYGKIVESTDAEFTEITEQVEIPFV